MGSKFLIKVFVFFAIFAVLLIIETALIDLLDRANSYLAKYDKTGLLSEDDSTPAVIALAVINIIVICFLIVWRWWYLLKTFFVEDTNLDLFERRVNNLLDRIQNDKENKFGFFNKIVDIRYQNQHVSSVTAAKYSYYSVMIIVDYFKDELSRDLAYSKSGIDVGYCEFGESDS